MWGVHLTLVTLPTWNTPNLPCRRPISSPTCYVISLIRGLMVSHWIGGETKAGRGTVSNNAGLEGAPSVSLVPGPLKLSDTGCHSLPSTTITTPL